MSDGMMDGRSIMDFSKTGRLRTALWLIFVEFVKRYRESDSLGHIFMPLPEVSRRIYFAVLILSYLVYTWSRIASGRPADEVLASSEQTTSIETATCS
jgi:hypothetical protein